MTDDLDLAAYRFWVPLPAHLPQMYFDNLVDAEAFARACLDARCVRFLHPDRVWRVIWRDGELVSHRDGFYVHVPWAGQGG